MTKPTIQHISDTARWAAVFRACESERPDALFKDPFARKLAGARGEDIAAANPFHNENSWSWVARTCAFDEFISSEIRSGADTVLNLAAGLDARPYRMDLPQQLTWVEVDLPGILDYKEEVIDGEPPRCKLERIRLDLGDLAARRELFRDLNARSKRVLILTEGLIIYLTAEEAGSLAEDLIRQESFHRWILDLTSPGLLKMLLDNTGSQFAGGVETFKFAPENGPDFFLPHGWRALDIRSMLKTGAAIKRLPGNLEPFLEFPEDPVAMGERPWSGVCLMGRSS